MNQSQLIDIIGNKDVVTIIQGYMCGTPLIRPDDDDEVEDVQRAIELCRIREKLRKLLCKQIEDNCLSFNNRTHTERRIFGIPEARKQSIYALIFEINGDRKLFRRLRSIDYCIHSYKVSYKVSKCDPIPKKVSLLVYFDKMEHIVTLLRIRGYVFDIRDISNNWYSKHIF